MAEEIERFRIRVPDAVLADLRERLARTRWPDALSGSGWSTGTDLAYLKELCAYWRDGFDWRAQEARLNRLEQFTTPIDGERLHFVHQRSKEPGALPLVVTHGWPGGVAEFTQIVGPLSDPAAHGGDPRDAFHVVCPSMPGYGFSGPTHSPGWDIRRVAAASAALMQRLGYARYGAQGGDWGAAASTQLAMLVPERLVGIHLNFVLAGPPQDGSDPFEGVTPEERAALAATEGFESEETGYQRIQGTRPQTLAYGLNDSPAGLAGWIVEKFRAWSDCKGDVESRFTKDELLTHVTIYWVTQTIHSSMRLYCETMRGGRWGMTQHCVTVPTGCAIFPGEMIQPPRRWAERFYPIRRWTRMASGGHFAALEEPEALVDEIRAFFRELR
jgi:microsomal epoxide hydrolase